MTRPLIIAVDFDGTLFEKGDYPDFGAPNRLLGLALNKLRRDGVIKVILWTCREGDYLTAAVRACKLMLDLEFDAVNKNLPEQIALFGNDSRKIGAHYYIDDRSLVPFDMTYIFGKVCVAHTKRFIEYMLERDMSFKWTIGDKNVK